MMNKEIPIVLGMDANSVSKMKILIKSIKTHMSNSKIYLITDREVDVEWADEIKIFLITGITNCGKAHATPHSYYPLFINLLFPELEKCIYLGFDTIILDDISELLEGDDWVLKVGNDTNSNYISSAVMVMNLKNEKFIECIAKCRKNIKNGESLAINILNNFGKNITRFERKYNVPALDLYLSIKDPKVIHYIGIDKPFSRYKLWKYYYKFV